MGRLTAFPKPKIIPLVAALVLLGIGSAQAGDATSYARPDVPWAKPSAADAAGTATSALSAGTAGTASYLLRYAVQRTRWRTDGQHPLNIGFNRAGFWPGACRCACR